MNSSYFIDKQSAIHKDDRTFTQSNYHFSFGINVSFQSWWSLPNFDEMPSIVAVWRVKSIKPKPEPVATTQAVEPSLNTFSIN